MARITKAQAASLIKTARAVLDEKLDIAGFHPDGITVSSAYAERDGSVTFTLTIGVTDLDIEQARSEGK